jgi:hypothetical protein
MASDASNDQVLESDANEAFEIKHAKGGTTKRE